MNIFKSLIRILKKSKMAVVSTVAVSGGILMATSFTAILPETVSVLYKFLIGLGLVIFGGYLGTRL